MKNNNLQPKKLCNEMYKLYSWKFYLLVFLLTVFNKWNKVGGLNIKSHILSNQPSRISDNFNKLQDHDNDEVYSEPGVQALLKSNTGLTNLVNGSDIYYQPRFWAQNGLPEGPTHVVCYPLYNNCFPENILQLLHKLQLNDENIPTEGYNPKEPDVKFFVHSRTYRNNPKNLTKSTVPAEINKQKIIRVVSHGYYGKCSEYQPFINGLLDFSDCTVICVDWNRWASAVWYPSAANKTFFVGNELGRLMHHLKVANRIDYSKLHMIGFSLGAHVIGFGGKLIHKLSGKRDKVLRITGLDAAGPSFNSAHPDKRLWIFDGHFVDTVHTCSTYGLSEPIGWSDYYPNGGSAQPGCITSAFGCSHERAYSLFISSLKTKCQFNSTKCQASNCNKTLKGLDLKESLSATSNKMGIRANRPETPTTYHLKTTGKYGFC